MTRPVIAFGPVMPGWGSWDWVGADVSAGLAGYYHVVHFRGWEVPDCDAVVIVKHALPTEVVRGLAQRAAVIYCPVDYYGSAGHVHADRAMLSCCARVLVHCRRLLPLLESYCSAEYIDHHVKFAAPLREHFRDEGYFLWIGVRTNLPPLVEWVNSHPLPGQLRVLTNPEDPAVLPSPRELGFREDMPITIENWTPGSQLALTRGARAALDIKGDDFRSRHKPPAKAIDFIASGVPLALNPGSSPAEHLAGLGFRVASPLDLDRWLSPAYWQETRCLGQRLRGELSLGEVARRFQRVIDEVLAARRVINSGDGHMPDRVWR